MAVTKTEGGVEYRASDYADVADPEKPSTWKLRLAEGSSGHFTVAQVARAITAMQPGGFRGNRVELGSRKGAVVSRINAAIGKSGGDDTQKENLRKRLTSVKEFTGYLDDDDFDEAFEEAAKELAEKCGEAPAYSQPYGGAMSFDELDREQKAQEFTSVVSVRTYQLQAIIDNIIHNDDLSPDDKAAAIVSATGDFKARVSNIALADPYASMKEVVEEAKAGRRMNGSMRDHIGAMFNQMKKLVSWANYDDGEPDADESAKKEMPLVLGAFKVIKTKDGGVRWLSLSSNAFQDLDKELFTTEALKEAVEYADGAGERGPLLIYHVPSAEIGQCDYQAVIGRFLVESGTFDDTPMGRKASDFFVNSDEEHQVSIGYQYRPGDEQDGVYDWLRIKERSVTPYGAAANPWTDFRLALGGKEMEEKRRATLVKILGDDLADQVIATAESKTKELEDGQVKFKASTDLEASIKAMAETVAAMPEGDARKAMETNLAQMRQAAGLKEEASSEAGDGGGQETNVPDAVQEALTTMATAMSNLSTQLTATAKSINERLDGVDTKIKELSASEDEKIAAKMAPRLQVVTGSRPTDDVTNLVDPEKVKELGIGADDQPTNPARTFVEDILNRGQMLGVGTN